jgi:hypothetical protein
VAPTGELKVLRSDPRGTGLRERRPSPPQAGRAAAGGPGSVIARLLQKGRIAAATSTIDPTPYLLPSANRKVVTPFGNRTQ